MTQAFVQKQVLPMGTFTRYTWLLTNVLHVKQVFDTPLVSLEVSRKFTQSNDGSTFKLVAEENNENCGALNKKTMKLIRPLEFKTFLKVGQMSSDPRNVTPFTIEYVSVRFLFPSISQWLYLACAFHAKIVHVSS